MEKHINYLARTFEDYRTELIKFSNKYYPEMADSYSDSSVGSWFIDIMASVSDNLGYHIDRMYQENNINSANLKSTVLNIARLNGLKVPGPKGSTCEVRFSCILGVKSENGGYSPNYDYAPIIKRSTTVSAGNYSFHLTEDVDFAEQFNKDGYSNRTFYPNRDTNGSITSYTVTKTAVVMNGLMRVYKKVLTDSDIKPFMEVVLPDTNVMNVESVICKEAANLSVDPDFQEYYINAEEYRKTEQAAKTYRFFEMDCLADQYLYLPETNFENGVISDYYNSESYVDYEESITDDEVISKRTTRIYKGKWVPITQKFITEYTDNGYMKLIFGSGSEYKSIPDDSTKYYQYRTSKIINNDMLGVLPKEGWTMYVLYNIGGGAETNLAPGAINNISLLSTDFHDTATSPQEKGRVQSSISVINASPSVGGKSAPSTEELKYMIKYNNSAQERCVTVKDYKNRLLTMPPKYGAPFRASVIEENNKIKISTLGLDSSGRLDKSLPETLVNNMIEYMSNYKSINDYVEMRSGKIYNIGFLIDVFVDKSYNTASVMNNIINKVQEYMDVNNHDMGEDIFIGDLEKEIMLIDGVLSLINLSVYNIYNGSYSMDKCPFPELEEGTCSSPSLNVFKTHTGAESYQIDLDAIDRVLYCDYNAMYEVKNINDIQLRVKER